MQKLGLGTPVNKDLAQDPEKETDNDQNAAGDVFLTLLSSMRHETDAKEQSTQVDPAMEHHQEAPLQDQVNRPHFAGASKVSAHEHFVARGSKQALPENQAPTLQTEPSGTRLAQDTVAAKTPGPAHDDDVAPPKQSKLLPSRQQVKHAPIATQPESLTTSPPSAAKASTIQFTAARESISDSPQPSPITSLPASTSTVDRPLAKPELSSGSLTPNPNIGSRTPIPNPGTVSETLLPASPLPPALSAERSTFAVASLNQPSISSHSQSPRRQLNLSNRGRSSHEGEENKISVPNLSPSPLVSMEGDAAQPPSSLGVHPPLAEVAATSPKTATVITTAQDAIAPTNPEHSKGTKQHWTAGKKTGLKAQKAQIRARQAPATGNNMPGFSSKDHVLTPDVHTSSCEDKIEAKTPPNLESGGIPPTTVVPQQSPDPQVQLSSSLRPMVGAPSPTSTPAPIPASQANMPTEHLVQTLRQAMDVKVTPHDLHWKDPQFGELSLRIERHGDELEISIRSAIAQTHETLKQHHLAIADELTLDPQQLRFEAPNSSDQQKSQEQSHSSPFSEQGPSSNAQQRETSTKLSKTTNATQPTAHPLSPSSQGLDLFA